MGQAERHRRGWDCVRAGGERMGFVDVVWGGAVQAFLLGTMVAARVRRRRVGTRRAAVAAGGARAGGRECLHSGVDDHRRGGAGGAGGFRLPPPGLIALCGGGRRDRGAPVRRSVHTGRSRRRTPAATPPRLQAPVPWSLHVSPA